MKSRMGRRWFWLVLLIPVLLGLARLRFNVEVLDLLPGDVPAVQGLKSYQTHFANTRELVITLETRDADVAERAAESLAKALSGPSGPARLAQWEPPWFAQPQSISELLAFVWLNSPIEAWEELTNRMAPERLGDWLEGLRQRLATSLSPGEIGQAGYDPLGLTRFRKPTNDGLPDLSGGHELFASPDGTFRLLFVQARSALGSYRECARWLDTVRSAVRDWLQDTPEYGGVQVGFTGQPAFMAEIGRGMERDMTRSIAGTLFIISVLFLAVHRRLAPLLWLLSLLAVILIGTLGLGGLLFGTLNVVSTGFAAILLGLAVDYGLVLYQEASARTGISPHGLQRELAPSILWAALTTSAAFLALNLSDLPGLAQLGALVTVGILLAALVMLTSYLPVLLPLTDSRQVTPAVAAETPAPPPTAPGNGSMPAAVPPAKGPWLWTALTAGLIIPILITGRPVLDHSADALRPRDSAAYAALEHLKRRMSQSGEPFWLLVHGMAEQDVARSLDRAHQVLRQAQAEGLIQGFTLPTALWARPDRQSSNRLAVRSLLHRRDEIQTALREHGFAEEAFALTGRVFDAWEEALAGPQPYWPGNPVSTWILNRFLSRSSGEFLALGLVHPAGEEQRGFRELTNRLDDSSCQLASWAGLGETVLQRIRAEFSWLSWLMTGLILTALVLAFRRATEVLLSVAVLVMTLGGVLAVMQLAGWSWNLMNLMALPLLLGTSVDYSIHIQLALRRNQGDPLATRRSTGRALLLCGATTITAFGSLAWSSNAGLASLGQVCAVGIACAVLNAVFLLPAWWRFFHGPRTAPDTGVLRAKQTERSTDLRASRLYSVGVWQVGLGIVRLLPESCSRFMGRQLATFFRRIRPSRFEIVVENLLPALGNDRQAAQAAARRLFGHFGLKIADLWRYEAGRNIEHLVGNLEGGERFFSALQTGRGVLLVTPHLGNWEFGAPLLARHGIRILALTMEEPSPRLTELRRASRRQWGVETLVIQRDPFAFVEVLRQLEAGATVALLVDRPPATTAVPVELFGRLTQASIAPAELARASGCIVLPVFVVQRDQGYHACVLPEITYDRPALRRLEARQSFSRQIMRAFEPVIQQHIDQWYHFVPVWTQRAQDPQK